MASTCLDENSALDFLSGRLGPNALSEAERHLGVCAPCVELLARSAPFFPPSPQSLDDGQAVARQRPSVSTLAMPAKRAGPRSRTLGSDPLATGEDDGGRPALDGDDVARGAPATLAYGTVIKDTYTVLDLIGRGGMGEVYEVQHSRLAGRYALKLLPPAFAAEHVSVTRFRREADITSALRHPNIVQVIDFDHTPAGQPFLVMEFLDGGDLGQLMATSGAMPLPRVLKIVEQIVSALSAVHRKGIVHRDLKPQNVLLIRDDGFAQDRVKLVDFGLSKRSEGALFELGSNISRDQTLLGTPRYMAPEQAAGRIDEIDSTTDQFALAAMVYEMLTGTSAFDGDHMAMLLYRIVSEEPIPMRRIAPEVPEHVEAAVRRAMAKQRASRFSTVSDFLEALCGNARATAKERSSDVGGGLPGGVGARSPTSSSSGAAAPVPPGISEQSPVKPAGRLPFVSFGIGVTAALALAVGWRILRTPAQTQSIALPPRVTGAPAPSGTVGEPPPSHLPMTGKTAPNSPSKSGAPPASGGDFPEGGDPAGPAFASPESRTESVSRAPKAGPDATVAQTERPRKPRAGRIRRRPREEDSISPHEPPLTPPPEVAPTRDPGILVEHL